MTQMSLRYETKPVAEEPAENQIFQNLPATEPDPTRYFGSFVDKRNPAPLRPSYAFPRLYQPYFQAMYDKLRSVRHVDLVNELEEIMSDITPERENKLRISSCAIDATIENLLTSTLICLASSHDLYLDLSEIVAPAEDITGSLEMLFELFFDVEFCSVR